MATVRILHEKDDAFDAAFASLLADGRGGAADVDGQVREIIAAVRRDGVSAVLGYTEKFDGFTVDAEGARVSAEEIAAAYEGLAAELRDALVLAAQRIRDFHARQTPADDSFVDSAGVELGWRWTAVKSAGLYAPGGRAAYPSSVLMNAIPAKVAGVDRLVMCVPSPGGVDNMAVLAAAKIAGIDEVWRIGGAQAIAAMAYGAGPIAPVDVIVGPGNAYVAEAKRQVFGRVGIDSVAGPSEILVVADAKNDPDWIAADLLSQAEHDPSAQSILITDDHAFAEAVAEAADKQIAESPRAAIMGAAWRDNSAVIVVDDFSSAPALIDAVAPEHLELAIDAPSAMLDQVRHAGAAFLGRYAPEALGDYLAGPNHVLPTSGAARYASGLSVLNFMKRTTIVGADRAAFAKIAPQAATIADAEGLAGHARSLRCRLDDAD